MRFTTIGFWKTGQEVKDTCYVKFVEDAIQEELQWDIITPQVILVGPFISDPKQIETIKNGYKGIKKIFFSSEHWERYPLAKPERILNILDNGIGFGFGKFSDKRWFNLRYDEMALWEVNYKDWSNRKYIASHIGRHNEKGIRGNICDIFHDAICEIEDKQIEPMIHYPSTFRKNVDPIPDRFHNDWESKIEWLKDYKYNICPENCQGQDYITEKPLQAALGGCIPVYWNDKNTGIPNYMNPNKIIYLEISDTKEQVKQKIKNVLQNFEQPTFLDKNFVQEIKEKLDNFKTIIRYFLKDNN